MSRMNHAGWVVVLALVTAGAVEAKQWKYAGMHPRTGQPDGGLCHIQVVHVHGGPPVHGEVLYREHSGVYFFIGDPAPFGYEGPKHSYYGHHPVAVNVVLEEEDAPEDLQFCYMDGPHFHYYPPPPGQDFDEKEDVYYYADEYPQVYHVLKPKLVRVNVIYRPWRYVRPVVVGPPPPSYHGPILEVNVGVPLPSIEVNVGAVPVVHEVHHHHHGKHKHHKHKHHKHGKHKGWK